MKKLLFILLFIFVCSNCFSAEVIADKPVIESTQDYWVYVRLEDRSGVTESDDAGRSKAGDVVAILPVNKQNIPSATEKRSYMIYKTTLTEAKKSEMLEVWEEEVDGEMITKAYRKNKLDTSKLGVTSKKGLVAEKIDATKIETNKKTQTDLNIYRVKQIAYSTIGRPLVKLANVITRKAWAETVSTINKSGEDYNTLTLWEDAKDGDLVTETRQETAECYDDDGALVEENVTIDGSTTSTSYYMKITVPVGERHSGTLSDGSSGNGFVFRRGFDGNGTKHIWAKDNYTKVEWLQLNGNSKSTEVTVSAESSGNTFSNLIIANYTTYAGIYLYNGGSHTVKNCIIYNISSNGIFCRWSLTGSNYVYNNTLYNNGSDGIWNNDVGSVIKNNISMGNTGDDFDFNSPAATTSANLSSDTTANDDCDDTNCLISKTDTNQFVSVTGGSEDLHIKVGSDAIGAGVDLSGVFTDDIDGDTRSTPWDIGADEYVSAASARRMMIIQ